VLEALGRGRPDLAESIRGRMFVFEDIARIPRSRLRPALEVLESEELAIALRTTGEDVKKKVLGSLPRRSAREVRQEMHRIGPVRLSDVEGAQQCVMEAIRRTERGVYVSSAQKNQNEVLA
jgi:flagellar motor switch protein FliG